MHFNIKTYDIVGRMVKMTGLNQKDIGEQVFNKSKNSFNNQLRANRIDWKTLIEWAVNNKVDLNWLLTGRGNAPVRCGRDGSVGAEKEGDGDTSNLRSIITMVEEALETEGLTLPLEKKAELIALLYEHSCESGKEIEGKTVMRYLRLVA